MNTDYEIRPNNAFNSDAVESWFGFHSSALLRAG